jgi:uncharacterized integral membrane protein
VQIFLFGALAISLLAVLFALQNNVPVMVTFLGWTFQGSLALVLFLAVVAGATASVLASLPTLIRGRWAGSQSRKQISALEVKLADSEQRLRELEQRARPPAPPEPVAPTPYRNTN